MYFCLRTIDFTLKMVVFGAIFGDFWSGFWWFWRPRNAPKWAIFGEPKKWCQGFLVLALFEMDFLGIFGRKKGSLNEKDLLWVKKKKREFWPGGPLVFGPRDPRFWTPRDPRFSSLRTIDFTLKMVKFMVKMGEKVVRFGEKLDDFASETPDLDDVGGDLDDDMSHEPARA